MLFTRTIVTTAVTTLAPVGSSDSGIVTPEVESSGPAVLMLGLTGDSPTPPTVAEIYAKHSRITPAEQKQLQQTNEGLRPDHIYCTVIPVAPDPGTIMARCGIVHLLTAAAAAGNYEIGDATTFSTAAWTLPAVNSASALSVVDSAGFAVDDVVIVELGVLCQVTATGAGTITLQNLGEPAAIVSVSA